MHLTKHVEEYQLHEEKNLTKQFAATLRHPINSLQARPSFAVEPSVGM